MFKRLIKFFLYEIYERRLGDKLKAGPIPKHLGVILDGNRRFAKSLGVETSEGHRLGAKKVRSLLQWCGEFRIPVVTLWAFSTQNKSRDPQEVAALMDLFTEQARTMLHDEEFERNDIRVKVLGRRDDFPVELQEALNELEQATAKRKGMLVQLALGYGGREEIVDAVKSYLTSAPSLPGAIESLNEEVITQHLYSHDVPDPDFIIRTSGEVRLSGFLLWQAAYSEYYFVDVNWPGFRRVDFLRALRSFQSRQRRFGK
jgi:short-chain Z-isoprenyl diphosphate synthase